MNGNEKKPKKILHPNSRKNLKPFEKGCNPNPIGGNAHDPVKREMKKFTSEFMQEIIHAATMGKLTDLETIMNDPDAPAIKRGLARAVHNASMTGNWSGLEHIVTRIVGKVPDKVEVNATSDHNIAVKFVKTKNGN